MSITAVAPGAAVAMLTANADIRSGNGRVALSACGAAAVTLERTIAAPAIVTGTLIHVFMVSSHSLSQAFARPPRVPSHSRRDGNRRRPEQPTVRAPDRCQQSAA